MQETSCRTKKGIGKELMKEMKKRNYMKSQKSDQKNINMEITTPSGTSSEKNSQITQLLSQVRECPYCKKNFPEIMDFQHPSGHTMYYVSCQACHASGPEFPNPTISISQWNLVSEKVMNRC